MVDVALINSRVLNWSFDNDISRTRVVGHTDVREEA